MLRVVTHKIRDASIYIANVNGTIPVMHEIKSIYLRSYKNLSIYMYRCIVYPHITSTYILHQLTIWGLFPMFGEDFN